MYVFVLILGYTPFVGFRSSEASFGVSEASAQVLATEIDLYVEISGSSNIEPQELASPKKYCKGLETSCVRIQAPHQ